MNKFYDLIFFILKAYLIIGFTVIENPVYSQNQKKADSLIYLLELKENRSDSVKFDILRGILNNHTNQDVRIKYANKALEIAKKSNNLLWLYQSTLNIGYAYKKKGDLKKALEAFFQSAAYAKKTKHKKGEAGACNAIGSVYRVQGNYPTALYYYNLGITQLRILADSSNLAISLMNTGELYRTQHILDTALLYFKESGEIFDLKGYKIGIAYNIGNIGLVYAEQGKHIRAEEYILKATKILEELGDTYPIAVYNTYMADIYKAKGDMPRALEYAQHSYSLAKADELKEQIRDASQKLSKLYGADKAYEKAFFYQEEYLAYRDSINNEETIHKMADLRTEYEVSQKQVEVDLLNQEKQTSRIIKISLLGLLLAVGALAVVYIKRNKEKNAANKLLSKQKRQLKIQHSELEVLNTTKDKFFSIVSHDLRGSVSSFKGLSTIMKLSLAEKKYDEIAKIVEMLDTSSNQLSSLLNNLLAWAVNQQGKFPYNPATLKLIDLVDDVLASISINAIAKQVIIKNNVGKLMVWADSESLKTIIRNLVSNAIKFTPNAGLVEVSAIAHTDTVDIVIADNGVGINADKLKTIFSPNELTSSAGTQGEKGLGLGLQLAYDFAKMNKGSILVESEEGVGSTFTIKLPVKKG